jgi:uncharacterized protein YecE (DUF72 family)
MSGIELADTLHSLHELREVLELRPLVVRRLDGDLDFDRLFNCRHEPLLRSVVGDRSVPEPTAAKRAPPPRVPHGNPRLGYPAGVTRETKGRIRIGCSGWNYAHWRNGTFYPAHLPASRWLDYYGERFDTVEVNATFYRLPTRRSTARWAGQTAEGFLFAVKVSRYVTHVVRLRDAGTHLTLLLERLEPLDSGAKLGPLLWQLPPTFRCDEPRLASMLADVPKHLLHAIEFRHPSWFEPGVFELLRAHNVAVVVADRPGAPATRELEPTADFVYVRFHHGSRGRRGNYSRRELEGWAATIDGWAAGGRDVYAYFNNDWEGFAPANAETLKAFL